MILKKTSIIFLTASLFVVSLLFFSFAQPEYVSADFKDDLKKQNAAFAGSDGADLGKPNDPRLIVANIIKAALGLLGTLVLIYMVYGGYLILLSGGNEEKIAHGKSVIVNSAIGLLIILSAYSITRFAVRLTTGDAQKQGTHCKVEGSQKAFYNANDPQGGYNDGSTVYQDCITE